eukprot:6415133-Amphidinium_carterae.1
MSSLLVFDIAQNQFAGALPEEGVIQMTALMEQRLYMNLLSKTLPGAGLRGVQRVMHVPVSQSLTSDKVKSCPTSNGTWELESMLTSFGFEGARLACSCPYCLSTTRIAKHDSYADWPACVWRECPHRKNPNFQNSAMSSTTI